MKQINPFTNNNIDEDIDKSFYFFRYGKLFISNEISPDDLIFFEKYYDSWYTEIVYFESELVFCPDCGNSMNKNGSRSFKPNKYKNVCKQQYICPVCGKTHVTSLEKFIDENSNYTRLISHKLLEYEYIAYFSYQKKAELIELENKVQFSRQTAYYLASKYSDTYIEEKEKEVNELLKKANIEPSGIYHYDEEYLEKNGEEVVRLSIIDAVNNLIINDQFIYKKDFDKDFIKIFLKYSLDGLPKKVLVTDGHPAYPDIIEQVCIKQQLCIFHIIKNHHTDSFKKINNLEKRIDTINSSIDSNEKEINKINEQNKGLIGRVSKTDTRRQKRINKRKDLIEENKKFRSERKEKKKKLKELNNTNERISNIYKTDTEKAAFRRFKTIYNQLNQFDDNTQKYLKNLLKKFNKTTTYLKNDLIPKTNNKIEGYFKITLPKYLKRIYRTQKGLKRWTKMQQLRWTQRNVLTQ